MKTIVYEDQEFDMEKVRREMDDEIAGRIEGTVESDQEFFDTYLIAHQEKYGQRFVVR